eukprot:TRINITY_DN14155_c0_g1_i1.p1 TRINITY_DN14155_c0_g1~~TRINITY_DN14155_c0_g1_i1.p1  ORF type:complete len:129 (-),score=32.79 TRINITY_DN14155_c0_g1_i1:16-378(-)
MGSSYRNITRMILTVLFLCDVLTVHGFLLDSITMSPELFDQCSTCDARADRAGNRAVADALREFMTRNHVKLAVESGDVVVSENLPNQKIDTGHSCSKTAEARDGRLQRGWLAKVQSLTV